MKCLARATWHPLGQGHRLTCLNCCYYLLALWVLMGLRLLGLEGSQNHLWVTLYPVRWREEVGTIGGHCEKCSEGLCGALK